MLFGNKKCECASELTKYAEKLSRLEAQQAAFATILDASTQKLNSLRALMNRKMGYDKPEQQQEDEESPIPGFRLK